MVAKALQAMVEYYGRDHRMIGHALKVYGLVRAIALREGVEGERLAVLECAAALHDIGVPESLRVFGASFGKHHEIMGRKITGELLGSLGFGPAFIGQVEFLVSHHHSYAVDGGILLQILLEADLLVNLDEGRAGGPDPCAAMETMFKTRTGRELLASMYGLQPLPPERRAANGEARNTQ